MTERLVTQQTLDLCCGGFCSEITQQFALDLRDCLAREADARATLATTQAALKGCNLARNQLGRGYGPLLG